MQNFIGLAVMVPEIIRNGKKPGLNRVKDQFDSYFIIKENL